MLQKQVADLTQKSQHSKLSVKSKLQQKDSELLEMKKMYLKDVKGLIERKSFKKKLKKSWLN